MNDMMKAIREESEFEIFLRNRLPIIPTMMSKKRRNQETQVKPSSTAASTNTYGRMLAAVRTGKVRDYSGRLIPGYIHARQRREQCVYLAGKCDEKYEDVMKTNTTLRKEVHNLRQQLEDLKDQKIYLRKKIIKDTRLGDYITNDNDGAASSSTGITIYVRDGKITMQQ